MKNIKELFKYVIWWNIKSFFRKIGRVLDWLPVIWDTSEFDYQYLYKIMYHHLGRMKEFFLSDKTHVVGTLVTAQEIDEVMRLMERQMNPHLIREEHMAEFEEKYGEYDFFFGDTPPEYMREAWEEEVRQTKEALKDLPEKEREDLTGYPLMTTYSKVETPEEYEEAMEEHSRLAIALTKKEKEEHDLMWEKIKEWNQGWWD